MDKEPNSEEQPAPPERSDTSGDSRAASQHPGFRAPLGENAVEQLRRYQVITLPPDARAAFLSAKLPGASPELLYDTLPPNAGAEHASGALELPQAEPGLEAEPRQHDADPERADADADPELTGDAAPGGGDRHLRGIAIVGGILLVAALLLGWVTLSGDREIQRALGRQSLPRQREAPAEHSPAQLPATLRTRTEAPPAAAVTAPAPARPAGAAPPSVTEQKPATHVHAAPNGKTPVASPAPPSEPATAPTHPPAASSAAATGKKFRLGSR